VLLPEPLWPTRPIISPGAMFRSTPRRMPSGCRSGRPTRELDAPLHLGQVLGLAGSGTLETWSRMSKMRLAPAAAFWVTETMRLIESSRV
jgi:hypothetical protein